MWIQNNVGGLGGMHPPENFEINGAIWCVLGPPESFLDQRKVFSVVIIKSGERG